MKLLVLTLTLTIVFIAVAVVLLGIKVFFIKGGRFPSGHAHANPELRRRGVRCASRVDDDDI